jgi:hypothetical protein
MEIITPTDFMNNTISFELKSKLIYTYLKNNQFSRTSHKEISIHVYGTLNEFFVFEDPISIENKEKANIIVEKFFFNHLKQEMNHKKDLTDLDKSFIQKLINFEKSVPPICLWKTSTESFKSTWEEDLDFEINFDDSFEVEFEDIHDFLKEREMNKSVEPLLPFNHQPRKDEFNVEIYIPKVNERYFEDYLKTNQNVWIRLIFAIFLFFLIGMTLVFCFIFIYTNIFN